MTHITGTGINKSVSKRDNLVSLVITLQNNLESNLYKVLKNHKILSPGKGKYQVGETLLLSCFNHFYREVTNASTLSLLSCVPKNESLQNGVNKFLTYEKTKLNYRVMYCPYTGGCNACRGAEKIGPPGFAN